MGVPSADDVGRYRAFENALVGEMEAVEYEAAWLGDRSRTVWQKAFELAEKRAEQQQKAQEEEEQAAKTAGEREML